MKKIKLATLFSGIGSPETAAKRVYDEADLVFACEIDKFARISFKANFDIDDRHFHKDIYDLDGTKYKGKVDILVGGSPCQDFSIAGLRAGVKGERGKLIYEYFREIKEVEPSIFIYENVKGMLSDRKGKTIDEFLQAFKEIGYNCHYKVINTKDYGVPQNRERIFIVGFKDVELYRNFDFANKQKLTKRLKDILEDKVEDKYYLSCPFVKNMKEYKNENNQIDMHTYKPRLKMVGTLDIKGNDSIKRVYGIDGICPTLTTMQGGKREPKIYESIEQNSKERSNTGEDNYRIRKLTPRECFKLQDFPDSFLDNLDYGKPTQKVSNTQLYKQIGNSISVNVMEMIFRQIEKAKNIQ